MRNLTKLSTWKFNAIDDFLLQFKGAKNMSKFGLLRFISGDIVRQMEADGVDVARNKEILKYLQKERDGMRKEEREAFMENLRLVTWEGYPTPPREQINNFFRKLQDVFDGKDIFHLAVSAEKVMKVIIEIIPSYLDVKTEIEDDNKYLNLKNLRKLLTSRKFLLTSEFKRVRDSTSSTPSTVKPTTVPPALSTFRKPTPMAPKMHAVDQLEVLQQYQQLQAGGNLTDLLNMLAMEELSEPTITDEEAEMLAFNAATTILCWLCNGTHKMWECPHLSEFHALRKKFTHQPLQQQQQPRHGAPVEAYKKHFAQIEEQRKQRAFKTLQQLRNGELPRNMYHPHYQQIQNQTAAHQPQQAQQHQPQPNPVNQHSLINGTAAPAPTNAVPDVLKAESNLLPSQISLDQAKKLRILQRGEDLPNLNQHSLTIDITQNSVSTGVPGKGHEILEIEGFSQMRWKTLIADLDSGAQVNAASLTRHGHLFDEIYAAKQHATLKSACGTRSYAAAIGKIHLRVVWNEMSYDLGTHYFIWLLILTGTFFLLVKQH